MPVADLNLQLQKLYEPCCNELPSLADVPKELAAAIEAMMYQVWIDKGMPAGLINKEVTTLFAEKLWSGAVEGYGNDFSAFDWDTPDHNMLLSLEKNTWHFSGAKNYSQLREMSQALIGPDGKLRTEKQFFDAAYKINDRHVKQYLSAEYDLAVSSSQMASKWVDIENSKEDLSLLEFDAVLDTQTTAICRGLHKTLRPWNDPFWDIYYPPNHYRCRSTVRQLSKGKITTDIPGADIPDMFKNNLAKSGLVFPEGHGYWVDLPDEVITKADKLKPVRKK